eukprot:COSAG01_NODE_6920_length_3438_cov_14.474094_1_plen_82_part_00
MSAASGVLVAPALQRHTARRRRLYVRPAPASPPNQSLGRGADVANIISLKLQLISYEFGQKVANETIVEFGLDKMGWHTNE